MTSTALSKKIVICGAHLTPALELISQLQSDSRFHWQITYIGRDTNSSVDTHPSIESIIIPQNKIPFYGLSVGKLDRRWLPNTLRGIPKTIKSLLVAFRLISRLRPDLVVSFGGYVSVPVIIAARIRGIPSITHEQTLTISLSTRINSWFVDKVALSFPKPPSQLPADKTVVTGNLLRHQIYSPTSTHFSSLVRKFPPQKIIYITAGNQGSKLINDTIVNILPQLTSTFTLIHSTGEAQFPKLNKLSGPNYWVFPYIDQDNIGWVLHHSDIIISRSGANTSQEIVALHKKSILIPLPVSSQDEQRLNASWVKKHLPAQTKIIPQKSISPSRLIKAINQLAKEPGLPSPTNIVQNKKLLQLIHEIT